MMLKINPRISRSALSRERERMRKHSFKNIEAVASGKSLYKSCKVINTASNNSTKILLKKIAKRRNRSVRTRIFLKSVSPKMSRD